MKEPKRTHKNKVLEDVEDVVAIVRNHEGMDNRVLPHATTRYSRTVAALGGERGAESKAKKRGIPLLAVSELLPPEGEVRLLDDLVHVADAVKHGKVA